MKILPGMKVKDRLTGYQGIVDHIATFMHSATRVGLQAPVGADGKVPDAILVDVSAWKVIATFPAHKAAVSALVFSADGTRLVSAGTDGVIRFWGVK